MIQKLKTLILLITVLAGFAAVMSLMPVSAASALEPKDCPSGNLSVQDPKKCAVNPKLCSSGEPLKTDDSVCRKLPSDCSSKKLGLDEAKNECVPLGNGCDQKTGICPDNPIVGRLNDIVKVLSGLVGVVVVGVIILGGIQYAMAGDKAEAVSAAKKRISNGVLALVAFLFIFAFLQWLIPGGVFG